MLFLVTVGAIAVEGLRRLFHPEEVAGITVIVVAALGIAVNGATAWLFASGRKGDINLRAAFLHMAYDALVSLGVVRCRDRRRHHLEIRPDAARPSRKPGCGRHHFMGRGGSGSPDRFSELISGRIC